MYKYLQTERSCGFIFLQWNKKFSVIFFWCVFFKINKQCNLICYPDVSCVEVRKGQPWVENIGKEKPFLSVHLTVSGSFYCEDADGDVCVSPELSIWDLSPPNLKNKNVQRKKRNHPKSYHPELLLLFSGIVCPAGVVFPALYVFFSKILYCLC